MRLNDSAVARRAAPKSHLDPLESASLPRRHHRSRQRFSTAIDKVSTSIGCLHIAVIIQPSASISERRV